MDGAVDAGAVHKSVAAEIDRIESVMAAKWLADLNTITGAILKMCPAWKDEKDTLLSNANACQTLMANKHYKNIGGIAGKRSATL